ncbi:hypothetical protein V1264_000149 [Littorina saxatilis]|uniref:G-protein coupled receptors family 1 profile domain-containing protein n=1 Tax=Littorina saxatilis TaxID=31220 RepID=A0AAN9GPD7_9CAEN
MTANPSPPPCFPRVGGGNNASSNISNDTFNPDADVREKIIITMAIVRVGLAVFGFGANIIAAVVLTNRKLWSPTSMLLLSLVIYDAVYLLLVIPVGATSISINISFTTSRYSTLRTIYALCFPLRNMAQMASTYTTLTVTVERYLVILLPLKARSMWTYGKTRRAIVGVLLFSVIFNLPRCFDHILSRAPPSYRAGESSSAPLSSSTSSPLYASVGSVLELNLSSTPSWSERAPESVYLGLVAQDGAGSVVSASGHVNCTGHKDRDAASSTNHVPHRDSSSSSSSSSSSEAALTKVAQNLTLLAQQEGEGDVDSEEEEEDEGGVSVELHYFYKVVYQFYLTVIFLYLIPYTLIPVLNLQLVIALRRRKEETRRISVKNEHRINGVSTAPSPTDKEDGLTYIVFGITFCYFICCILPTVYMISAIASETSNDVASIYIFNAGETTLVINAATDFFFYCLLGRKFRRVFMRTFCPKRYLKKQKAMTMRSTVSYNSV